MEQHNDFSKFFKELWTDLSKVPEQDFSCGKQIKEVNEVFQEIKIAAESVTQKNVEVAVPTEAAGLELAESLETNLEKWLPDTPDQ